MEFGFTEEQQKLRKEVHDFFINELPEDFDPDVDAFGADIQAFWLDLQKKMANKGWLTAGWPKEYGGLGLTSIEQGVIGEEIAPWVRLWPNNVGYDFAAPAILLFGTEEQKKKFIPPLRRGEQMWFECLTEPDAGTDEANIKLRAVPDGDDYILNGQKTFISGAYKPDWLYTSARTADTVPKHRGITLFMVAADSLGITYRPLPTLGGSRQNEIFFDNVRVSKDYLLGQMNQGFYHTMATFEFERTRGTIDPKRAVDKLVQFCREEKRKGKPLIEDPEIRKIIAMQAIKAIIRWFLVWHALWRRAKGKELAPQPYDLSLYLAKTWSEPDAKALLDMFDLYGQLRPGSKYAKFGGRVHRRWESSRSFHAMGTIEALKIVIAGRGLGLPRIPRQFNELINKALVEQPK